MGAKPSCAWPQLPQGQEAGEGAGSLSAIKVCLVEEQPGLGWSWYLPPVLRVCVCVDLCGVVSKVCVLSGVEACEMCLQCVLHV